MPCDNTNSTPAQAPPDAFAAAAGANLARFTGNPAATVIAIGMDAEGMVSSIRPGGAGAAQRMVHAIRHALESTADYMLDGTEPFDAALYAAIGTAQRLLPDPLAEARADDDADDAAPETQERADTLDIARAILALHDALPAIARMFEAPEIAQAAALNEHMAQLLANYTSQQDQDAAAAELGRVFQIAALTGVAIRTADGREVTAP